MHGLKSYARKSVFSWFAHSERMENDGIARRVYVGDVGSHLVGRPQKWWIDSVNGCLNLGLARKMMYDRNEWQEFVRGECLGHSPGVVTAI